MPKQFTDSGYYFPSERTLVAFFTEIPTAPPKKNPKVHIEIQRTLAARATWSTNKAEGMISRYTLRL